MRQLMHKSNNPESPFVACYFCGSYFNRTMERFCPGCLDKVDAVKDLISEQKDKKRQETIEKFLTAAVLPNPEYAFPYESIEPLFEVAVRELFAQRAEILGYKIIVSRIAFPDYILEHELGQVIRAEAELKSSNFKHHQHDVNNCDLIICWKHDWKDCPLPVLILEP